MSTVAGRLAVSQVGALPLAWLLALACAAPASPSTTTVASTRLAHTATSSTSGASGASPPSARPLDTRERAAVERLVRATERARRLRFVEPVRAFVESPSAIAAHADAELESEEIERAGLLYRGLGLLPHDLDLRTHLRQLLGEQVLGYYDPRRLRLVLRDEVALVLATRPGSPSALDARLVVVHELTHALQAQHLGLAALHETERSSDADVAFHALVEGDAMLAMLVDLSDELRVPLERLVTDAAIDQIAAGAAAGGNDALLAAPPIVRVSLMAPYVSGLRFVRVLHGRGGFRAVDAAFGQLPASMEQVLHPERYLSGEQPEPVGLPTLPGLEAEGFEAVTEDTLGELELSIFLARGTGRDLAPAAANGWAGDRVRLYRRADEPAIVWHVRFDDAAEAREAEAALGASGDPADRFERVGRSLLVLRHVPERAAEEALAWFRAQTPPAPSAPSTPPR